MKLKHAYSRLLTPPSLVLILACSFLLVLLSTVKPDVFFSGDAGLKLLVVKQINNTGEYRTLHLQQPEWVQKIWRQGFYPFKEPFVYESSMGKLVSFPPAFQRLNAPLYKWFGFRGMYIIPSLSLVLLWCWFLNVLKKSGVAAGTTTAAFFLMAFCSPLTIYGAVYWEHTLALLLVFGGIVFIVRQPASTWQALVLGSITGLAAWFRPEALVLSTLLAGAVLWYYFKKKKIHQLFFIIGFATALIAFFVFNTTTYGSLFGAHSYQVLGQAGPPDERSWALTILTHIHARLFVFFPAAILFYTLLVYLVVKRPAIPPLVYQLAVIVLLYSLITPFILPNAGGKQWGPRYFLPLIPLMLVPICLASNVIMPGKKWLILAIPISVYSIYLNVYQAGKTLRNDYAYRVTPGLNFLKNREDEIVIVQNQYIAQEFSAAFDQKKFFLAENKAELSRLIDLLRAVNVLRVIYIDIENKQRLFPNFLIQEKASPQHIGDYYFSEYSFHKSLP